MERKRGRRKRERERKREGGTERVRRDSNL